ncbi:hypothetical protein FALBO_14659 [Fusarium albosuccineum]|uniref:Uncharacterized protein n=1 Tax=Fusarium albosuccineum TaxID=1237068 RepID=A0A8H4KZB7_9HYPO|nr:hypothetical protein FALBO_14659 [Fusarium albosuccineum]
MGEPIATPYIRGGKVEITSYEAIADDAVTELQVWFKTAHVDPIVSFVLQLAIKRTSTARKLPRIHRKSLGCLVAWANVILDVGKSTLENWNDIFYNFSWMLELVLGSMIFVQPSMESDQSRDGRSGTEYAQSRRIRLAVLAA